MKLRLYRLDGTLEGTLNWDPATGELSGELAEAIARKVRSIVAYGGMDSHPYPTFYPIKDPLHNLSEMAVVLGTRWRCPPELVPHWPELPPDLSDELPPDVVY